MRYRRIYMSLRNYTMIREHDFVDNLIVAQMVSNVRGCVVECGVWRGGMSAGICSVLGPDRKYYLFDSFEGLPPARAIDGQAAIDYQSNTSSPDYHDNCTAGPEFATQAMKQVGAKQFELVPGYFEKTLPGFTAPEKIAILRLDGDWYESTMTCLTSLFDQVADNGVIVVDDYYTWDGCSRAVHDFLSRRGATERIRSMEGTVCYLIKKAASNPAERKHE